jgi:hypothetical protein
MSVTRMSAALGDGRLIWVLAATAMKNVPATVDR